jgi:hypothetical protein
MTRPGAHGADSSMIVAVIFFVSAAPGQRSAGPQSHIAKEGRHQGRLCREGRRGRLIAPCRRAGALFRVEGARERGGAATASTDARAIT